MRSLLRVDRMSFWLVVSCAGAALLNNAASWGAASWAEDEGSAPAATAAPALLTKSTSAAADQCEKDKATAVPAGSSASKGEKKAENAMQKALLDAQEAYEKEKRDLQERLRKDPLWQPSHEQVSVIKVNEGQVESFCLSQDDKLLVCCGRSSRSVFSLFGGKDSSQGAIVRFNLDGKKIGSWKVPVTPQAICAGGDGTIYVAGAGKLAKLDRDGKVLQAVDAPNMAELPALPEVKKTPKKEGPEAEAAKQKKKEELRKALQQAMADYHKIAVEAQKELKPNDDDSMQAYQQKVGGPLEKLQSLQMEWAELNTTPEQRAMQLQAQRERMTTVTGMAITDRDLFIACAATKGYGFVVWRTDHNFGSPKKIVENLAGCCGQMDIQASGEDLWVAHNSRHKVEHYSRDGKKLSSFGKTDRTSADGFGGCCEPKNLRFGPAEVVFCCESGPPTCVKRYSKAGKFLGVAVVAPWNSGCVRVTTEYEAGKDRFFVLNSGEQSIHVFAKKATSKEPPATAALKAGVSVN
jgi:hypothetical protein